jgi:hypothetical protein
MQMKERNKGWRNRIQFLKWKRRLKRQANIEYSQPRVNGYVHQPDQGRITTMDLLRENAYSKFRTTSTPCSCMGCSGEHYKRHIQKREDKRLIYEYYLENL